MMMIIIIIIIIVKIIITCLNRMTISVIKTTINMGPVYGFCCFFTALLVFTVSLALHDFIFCLSKL